MKKLSIKNVKKLSKMEMKQIMAGSGTPACGSACWYGDECQGGPCPVCTIGQGGSNPPTCQRPQ
ncbi:MAG TPA: hypothetical protein VMT76_01760 [Puia sp.]|nr:hypothetical protein [Puia sp.]